MDVGRTSEQEGTLSWDTVRVGHFSYISKAQGDLYPDEAPSAGLDMTFKDTSPCDF